MAEETAGNVSKRGVFWKLTIIACAILVPAAAAAALYIFVLDPAMSGVEADASEPGDRISAEAVTLSFEESFTTVIMSNPNIPASLLLFQVTLECANADTAAVISRHQPRFRDMLTQLHSFRTREELNDPQVKESIQRMARDRANELLQRLPADPAKDLRVTDVFHERFAIQDQL